MPDSNCELNELKKELEVLKEKCTFLQRVLDEVPANIYISDLERPGVVWCNKTNEETLGYTLDEIRSMGMSYMHAIVHPDDHNIPADSITHYRSFNGAEYGGVFRARHRNEEQYRWFIGWAKAFSKNEHGEVKELVCVDVDMSPRMNTEEQLVAALKENLKKKNNLLINSLRKREVEVLSLVCRGLSTKAIAQQLNLSEYTVQTHRRNIQQKLGTSNVAELVLLATEAGLG